MTDSINAQSTMFYYDGDGFDYNQNVQGIYFKYTLNSI